MRDGWIEMVGGREGERGKKTENSANKVINVVRVSLCGLFLAPRHPVQRHVA